MLDDNGVPIRKDPADLIAPIGISGNIQTQMKSLDLATQIQKRVSVETGSLDNIANDMGLQIQGEFRSGTGEPGDLFTGVRIGWPGFNYQGVDWNIVGVFEDALQFGLSAANGAAYFAGGLGTIGEDGIDLIGLLKAFEVNYLNPSTGYSYSGRIEFYKPAGSSDPSLRIRYSVHNAIGYAANGNFETGDLTGHTVTVAGSDTFIVDTVRAYPDIFGGIYSAHANVISTGPADPRTVNIKTAVGSRFAVTPGDHILINFRYSPASPQSLLLVTLDIEWFDGGGSPISTDTLWQSGILINQSDPSWPEISGVGKAPALSVTAGYSITFASSNAGGGAYTADYFLDEIDIRNLIYYKAIEFSPTLLTASDEITTRNLMSGGGGGGAASILFDGM